MRQTLFKAAVLIGSLVILASCAKPVASPSAMTKTPAASNPAKSILLTVTSKADGNGKFAKVSYQWEVRNASEITAELAGQTVKSASDGNAIVLLALSKGSGPDKVTATLSISSNGATSNTVVNVGGASASQLSSLMNYDKSIHQLQPGVATVLAKGIGAFPSLSLTVIQ